jgi:trk system potassium uptake protein TrkH
MIRNSGSSTPTSRIEKIFRFFLALLSSIILILILFKYGYNLPFPAYKNIILLVNILLLASYLASFTFCYFSYKSKIEFFQKSSLDFILIFAILFASIDIETIAILIMSRNFISYFNLAFRTPLIKRFLATLYTNPAQLTLFSFFSIIVIGTYLLTMPAATATPSGASMTTALFTATSATCVTGLAVVDTGSFFSLFGQIVILLLIQIGGLGIMTLSTSLTLVFGRRMGIREKVTLQEIFEVPDAQTLRRIIIDIIKFTFWIESIGAFILFFRFIPHYNSFYQTFFAAVFHSISAFCNAGFGLFPDSLVRFQNDWIVNFTIAGLIITGGLGFSVIANIINRSNYNWKSKKFFRHLNVHTKIVMIVTFLLISLGTIIIFFFEFDNSLLNLSFGDKILAAFFQSITLRTAGFNSIDFSQLKNITIFMMLIWMFIGAAPGSTGGGIKVSTAGVLFLTLRTLLSGRKDVEVFRRKIPQEIVYKSIAITFVAIMTLSVCFGLLLAAEDHNFVHLLYESISAFGTVGLSLGVTPLLSDAGRLIIVLLMYIGRVGPLTLAYAIGEKENQINVNYPEGRIIVG